MKTTEETRYIDPVTKDEYVTRYLSLDLIGYRSYGSYGTESHPKRGLHWEDRHAKPKREA